MTPDPDLQTKTLDPVDVVILPLIGGLTESLLIDGDWLMTDAADAAAGVVLPTTLIA
jgi:hypothetical protein